ncbi:MAG: endonuclease/exonuclease/phosphatase family protein [Acidobacteriia bacterium]|nr:endonuclease/exonuclease/phosphatase family protein [Terriglobia bacterium]
MGRYGFDINKTQFTFLDDVEKKLTAKAITALNADVLALEEVENLDVLKRFRNQRLKDMHYTYSILVDGNDPRKIDIALLSRLPIVAVRSFQHLRDGNSFLFSRDLLEADIQVNGSLLTLFINHLKSMLDKKHPDQGRKNTRDKRIRQAAEVKKIVEDRFGSESPGSKHWIILGDFNDYLGDGQGTTSGITDLVTWSEVENVVDRLPIAERWTHFFEDAEEDQPRVRQLDYILLSSSLAAENPAPPVVVRKGLCTRATEATDKRFPGVTDKCAASDHCPVGIDITV